MRIICIDNKTNMELGPFNCIYTEGRIYDAIPDTTSYLSTSSRLLDVEIYKITDDTGHVSTYNFNADSGVWKNFRKLDEYREKKLNEIGI